MSLLAATRSEVTKQFSTALWWILALVLVLYVGSAGGGLAATLGLAAQGMISESEVPIPAGSEALVYSFAASLGYVFALLVGTLAVTSEFRHKTLTPTFLAIPRRGTALFAKLLLGILIGLLYGIIAVVSTVAPAAAAFAAFGIDPALGSVDTWAMFGRILLALVLWTLIGVGVGALVRNQVAAVVGVLAFTQFLEPIARLAGGFIDGADAALQYLPGSASDTLVGYSLYGALGSATASADAGMEWWGGAIVLAGYAVIVLLLGYVASWRRDVA